MLCCSQCFCMLSLTLSSFILALTNANFSTPDMLFHSSIGNCDVICERVMGWIDINSRIAAFSSSSATTLDTASGAASSADGAICGVCHGHVRLPTSGCDKLELE
eukprot:CAMPEP_0115206698 /NCGR_PEP_ID=MMETSP0270-20121206/20340_1 /TAXON_ID=71861 /ORGANISM="Scrippsiella trochoidea, Strain CCMP3099" /LENGTH=104 /DNA_ID=CAMNT_0002620279 /DNA_START=36 /DNA_END=347 /DNA_ORIENTATION=-